jgi:Cu(I)/Ag(I) efflux system membrane fusion protein
MNKGHTTILLIVGAIVGALVTIAGFNFFSDSNEKAGPDSTVNAKQEPLYWVAPMDPNYQRDAPGKSPMGMDLIPVFADENSAADSTPGTIRISPDVVNNLGVRTARVARNVLQAEIKTVGYVQFDEDQLVHIHPRVEGWIDKLYVKASGDPVLKNQPLYGIYSPELVNAQEELMLAIDRNNERLMRAAEDRLLALQLPKEAIKKLKQSREVSQTITFFAPQSGVIDNLNIREGFFVKPGTTLMSIGTLAQVWVEAEVFERQALQVAVGIPVTMSLDYLPGKEWQGKVDYVYPALDANTRTLKVRLRFENENDVLKPNMFAQVVIHASNETDALLVPREALIRTGNVNRVVLALGNGRFKSVEVDVGRFDEQSVEILAGLVEGELVVTSAQFLLDSESSKTSDFKRMNHAETDVEAISGIRQSSGQSVHDSGSKIGADHTNHLVMSSGEEADEPIPVVWVRATINNLMVEHRMVNLTHEAIVEWNWPDMTMDFDVAESVDMSELTAGMTVLVEIQKAKENQYQISTVRIISRPVKDQLKIQDDVDQSKQESMNHKNMNHESIDHSNHNG